MINLVMSRIKEFKQDNPFNSDTERSKWSSYNIIYQKELMVYIKIFGYHKYYAKVYEHEQSKGQLRMF